MKRPKNRTFRASLSHAWDGIWASLREERNLRFDCAMALAVVVCAFVFPLQSAERGVVLTLCAIVLAAELMNTALERVVDLAAPEYHELARRAKDTAAGAVLVAAIFAACIGLYIFVPYGLMWLAALLGAM